jgi:hypothetical protein
MDMKTVTAITWVMAATVAGHPALVAGSILRDTHSAAMAGSHPDTVATQDVRADPLLSMK